MALISSAYVQTILGYDDQFLDKIDLLIDSSVSRAENFIGRKLESALRTQYLAGTGGHKIILPIYPVTTITSISVDSERLYATLLTTSEYYLDSETGIITLFNKTTPEDVATIKIVYTAGWTEATLPADLKMAFVELIDWGWKRLNDHAFGMTTASSPDGVTAGYEPVMPLFSQRILESYKERRA